MGRELAGVKKDGTTRESGPVATGRWLRSAGWTRAKTRAVLIAVALCAAGAEAWHLLRTQPDTMVGCAPVAKPFDARYFTWVRLTMKEFHPQGSEFAGTLAAEVSLPATTILIGPSGQLQDNAGAPFKPPDPATLQTEFATMQKTFKQTMLRFEHYTDPAHGYELQGGSVGTFAMEQPKLRSSLEGKGAFTWTAEATRRSFYYPFDRYVLAVHPELLGEADVNYFPSFGVDQLTMDFSGTGFIPRLEYLGDFKDQRDRQRVVVQRPMLLRVITVVVGMLLVVWLLYLMISPKAGEQVGQVVTLFVGVFSVRNSLLSGAPVFPSFIDYCTLGIYLSAVLIVLIRWALPDLPGRTCPHCLSPVGRNAAVCAACTRDVAVDG